jgi:cytochrome c-type biogenesis protein CcmH
LTVQAGLAWRAFAPSFAMSFALSLALWAIAPGAATAAANEYGQKTDPAVEAQVQKIASELRCLVCQNETIAGSNADLAVDLRAQVRTMVQRGESQSQIIDYMTARYGDFVLYRPPVNGTTMALWFGPAILLVVGVGTLLFVLRRRARMTADRFEPDPDDLPS